MFIFSCIFCFVSVLNFWKHFQVSYRWEFIKLQFFDRVRGWNRNFQTIYHGWSTRKFSKKKKNAQFKFMVIFFSNLYYVLIVEGESLKKSVETSLKFEWNNHKFRLCLYFFYINTIFIKTRIFSIQINFHFFSNILFKRGFELLFTN